MTAERTRIEIPILLPDVPSERDACVDRLQERVGNTRGVLHSHVVTNPTSLLCLHYDPDVVSLNGVRRAAEEAGAAVAGRYGHTVLALRAPGSEDSAGRIERALRRLGGVLHASVSVPGQRALVEFDRERMDEERIRSHLMSLGYAAEDSDAGGRPAGAADGAWRWLSERRELALSLGAGALLAVAWGGSRWLGLPGEAAVTLYALAYLLGASDLVHHWVRDLREGEVSFNIDLLMLLAALGAAALGEWAEGAFLLFLFSLAHALEHMALDRARGAIRALAGLAPAMARVMRGKRMDDVPVEQVEAGDRVIVRPGERIPVDGTVRSGRSAVNQAPITGESVPVEKAEGDEVFAGTVNGDGALHIDTEKAAGDRTLDRVIQLVEEAETRKAPTERFTERFQKVFVPVVLLAAVGLALLPPAFGWLGWNQAFYRSMALLVAASPCALAIGTPSAVLAGIAQAARNGVLVKGGVYLEALGAVRALAMDKTGTLTEGRPDVVDVVAAEGGDEERLLSVAAAVERNSQHPLAAAVVRRAAEAGVSMPEAGDLESLTARGVRSSVEGESVEIGNLRLWEEAGVSVPEEISRTFARLEAEGRSVMAVRHGEHWLGVLGLRDEPRAGVKEVIERLHDLGIGTLVMLTGDNEGVARSVARDIGIDDVRAELLPEDKVDAVQALLDEHGSVAVVGDGVNDAPALATATVGIAMGGAGTAAALETADVALMGDALEGIPFVVGLSRQTRSVIRQNLFVSMAIIAPLILSTTTGVLGIGGAVAVHEGSTLIVVANALRLLRYGR